MLKQWFSKIEDFKTSFDRLSERERTLMLGLGGTFLLLMLVGGLYWGFSSLEAIKEENEAISVALKQIERNKDKYLKHRRKMDALLSRMSSGSLELNTYVERAASDSGVQLAESGEVAPVPLAGEFVQRSVEVKLRKVNIAQLGTFIKKLEDDRVHIVQVTQLSVSTRFGSPQDLDVEMLVSTYDRQRASGASAKKSVENSEDS